MKNKIKNLKGRTKVLLVIAAVVLLFAGLYVLSRTPKIGPIEDITAFYLEYSEAGDQDHAMGYQLKQNDDGGFTAAIISVDGDRTAPETQEFSVDEDFVQQVEELLAKNHVRWWKGHYESAVKSDSGLLENHPYTGSFSVSMASGEGMSSWISSKGPWNFQKVWRGVEALYAKLSCG